MIQDLPDVPPAIGLIAGQLVPTDGPGELRKKIVAILPELREQSHRFLEAQISRASDSEHGNRFEVHLHGAIDPLAGIGCLELACRVAATQRISRSVGLIADRVWLTDHLSDRILSCDEATPRAVDGIARDFIVIAQLLPLIAAGVIRFRSPLFSACKNCIAHFDQQVDEISREVTDAFLSEFSFGDGPYEHPYVDVGNAIVPSLVHIFFEKDTSKIPKIEEFARDWVQEQVRTALWVAREASITHGAVVSNSRAALAGLLHADGRTVDRESLILLEDERSLTVPWVSRLDAAQIVQLREEAAIALPRFREKMAAAMVFDINSKTKALQAKDLVLELREQAQEVRSELMIANKSSARFWKTTYGMLGLGLSAYGVATDQVLAGVGGLLPIIQLLINHKAGQENEALKVKARPGYVLMRAQDILAHSDAHLEGS